MLTIKRCQYTYNQKTFEISIVQLGVNHYKTIVTDKEGNQLKRFEITPSYEEALEEYENWVKGVESHTKTTILFEGDDEE